MGAFSAAANWAPEDDMLLKCAVEAGASLESLAKGAVCFSRTFTLQELKDRWCSLLYDSEASAQASARIVEYEAQLSTSSTGKGIRIFNSKAKGFSLRKRKINSVKHEYYSRRKRGCHEPCLPADFGYVTAPCSCVPVGSGCVCGGQPKPSESHHIVNKIDPAGDFVNIFGHIDESYDGDQDVYGQDNQNYLSLPNAADHMFIDGNINDENLPGCPDADQVFKCDYVNQNSRSSERNTTSGKDISDLQDHGYLQEPLGNQYGNVANGSNILLDTDHDQDSAKEYIFSANKGRLQVPGSFKAIRQQSGSRVPSILTWSKFENANSPDMLTDMHIEEQEILTLSCDQNMETTNGDTAACPVNIYNGVSGSGLDDTAPSESEFSNGHSVNCNQKENFELHNDKNILNSALETCVKDLGDPHHKVILKNISGVHILGLSDSHISNTCSNHIDPIDNRHSVADVSGTDMLCTLSNAPPPGCSSECRLNTEDSEIPCNDGIMISGHFPSQVTSTCDQNSRHNMNLVSNKYTPRDADDSDHTALVADAQPLSTPTKTLNEDCIVGTKPSVMYGDVDVNSKNIGAPIVHPTRQVLEEITCGLVQPECFVNLKDQTLNVPIRVLDQMDCKFVADKTDIGCGTATRNCISPHELPDVEFHNPIATMSSSGQGGSDDDNSVPKYSDIEALILDLDLIPWDQESDFIQPIVSRFQNLQSRKDLVRLEQSALSYMNRSIKSRGAFASLYGQHLKCYIKDPEVILGRGTKEVHVDIDLAKEGDANKISRRQAVIKMDERGSFVIKNIGKCPIFVNGKEVPCNKRINLISDALLEIRSMQFVFHADPDAVRRHIAESSRRLSFQGQKT